MPNDDRTQDVGKKQSQASHGFQLRRRDAMDMRKLDCLEQRAMATQALGPVHSFDSWCCWLW
jgi:hypothetical protein